MDENHVKTDDAADAVMGTQDDASVVNDVEDSTDEVERQEAIRRKAFLERQRKRAKVDLLEEEVSSIRTQLDEFKNKIDLLLEKTAEKKAGRPKTEDNMLFEQLETITKKIDTVAVTLDSKISEVREYMQKEREQARRRDLLQNVMGASSDFIQDVERGFINIPDGLLENYDELKSFIARRGGYPKNGRPDASSNADITRVRVVPHRDELASTGAIHSDKKTRGNVKEIIESANREIDDILNKEQGSGMLNKSDFKRLFELTDEIEKVVS